jgi:hypothetical protein
LEGEPFLETSAAEGVQAVEQCEGLVEEVGADLEVVAISRSVAGALQDCQMTSRSAMEAPRKHPWLSA